MTTADPFEAARATLWGFVAWTRTSAQRGTELAGRLLDLVVTRPAGRSTLPARGLQAAVEESKFRVADHDARRPPERHLAVLPRGYGRDRIVLLPRDPWTVFAYWEITPHTRLEASRALGPEAERAREVLRVYDVTFLTTAGDHACLAFDLEPEHGAESSYVSVTRPAASYCVEIGLRTPTSRFLPMARSNTVTLPPASPSTEAALRWVELPRHAPVRPAAGSADPHPIVAGTPPAEPFDGTGVPPPLR